MKMFFFISIILTVASIIFLVLRGGPNLGIDFAGGTSLQIKFNQATTIDKIRQTLDSINLGKNSIIQQVGSKGDNEFLLRTEVTTSDLKGLTDKIEETLSAAYGKGAIEIRKAEVVGPKAGKDLSRKGFLALCFSFIGMLIYISWRYEFRFALGGILALIHDVIVTVGVFTIMGKEFTLTVIAALLTIVGFSINDTVVVYDRIRENMKKSTKGSLAEIMNASINQTLSRTILTSLTVVLVLLALLFFGGEVLRDFTITLLIGVVFGTYSSVFIASPLVLIWENYRPTLKKKKK
jgi:preprotein translocase subunit SecF